MMNATQIAHRVRFITTMLLEEIPLGRAEVFIARLHAELPDDRADIDTVLNKVHEALHTAMANIRSS
jgi:hypothetical protein